MIIIGKVTIKNKKEIEVQVQTKYGKKYLLLDSTGFEDLKRGDEVDIIIKKPEIIPYGIILKEIFFTFQHPDASFAGMKFPIVEETMDKVWLEMSSVGADKPVRLDVEDVKIVYERKK